MSTNLAFDFENETLKVSESVSISLNKTDGSNLSRAEIIQASPTNRITKNKSSSDSVDGDLVDRESIESKFSVNSLPAYRDLSRLRTSSLVAQCEWEGYVTNIGDNTFTARIRDLSFKDESILEEAEFPISDVQKSDLDLLKIGGLFRWVVGHVRESGGSKRRASDIVFRRLPSWTKNAIDEAKIEAKEISHFFNK